MKSEDIIRKLPQIS